MTMVNSGLKGLNITICKCLVEYFSLLGVVGRGSGTSPDVTCTVVGK